MRTYLIGDVQGCFDSLQALLTQIGFNPHKDRLGFVGDLINRGPKSLETLQFITQLKNPLIVLGNHDLHFLALYFLGSSHFHHINHTLGPVLSAPNCQYFVDFLLQQPFLSTEDHLVMVHAGIPPQWSIETAKGYADELAFIMRKDPVAFFSNIYGNTPTAWNDDLSGWDHARYITNALTRMRFCTADGTLDLNNASNRATHSALKPWFSWRKQDFLQEKTIYFGHWASLKGVCDHTHIIALDTGCAWGEKLTAIDVDNQQMMAVFACD